MKDFDIEKLERKNIYRVDDNFFAEMQNNVIQKTVYTLPKVESRPEVVTRKKSYWWYAAAAAVALLFGSTFFINQNNGVAADDQVYSLKTPATSNSNVEENSTLPSSEEAIVPESTQNYIAFASDLNEVEQTEQAKTQERAVVKPAEKKMEAFATNNTKKVQKGMVVEQILEEFPDEDFEAIALREQSDIYMEVYY